VIFVFAGGGTGGHVVPAIALANELKSRMHSIFFIGNCNSIEERLAKTNSYRFYTIAIQKLYRGISVKNLLFPYFLGSSILKSYHILKQIKPDAVFCTGGFVSGPVAIAALWLRIPLFFHESNSYPGLVTRKLSKHISQTYIAFETSRNYLKGITPINFGIPIIASDTSSYSISQIGLDPNLPTIIVTGGSQGSLAINKVIDASLQQILGKGYQLIWQTGKLTYDIFSPKHKNTPSLYMFDFSPDMVKMLSKCCIAITRAGAMTIAELEEYGVPAILIPLPTAAENHQFFNAKEQQDKGVAILLEQSNLCQATLMESIDELTKNLTRYKQHLAKLPINQAAKNIADHVISNLTSSQGEHNVR
jgi:UDP-N-acetylglucosamine--N-acetylmuramyl-(pentapeptide) pyrophosphoryl-undecaprenol N-acetylglucosamine transferase